MSDDDTLAKLEKSWQAAQEVQQLEDYKKYVYKVCSVESDMGLVWKRGGNRTEEWQERRMTLQCGRLCYFKKGFFGEKLMGWSQFHEASIVTYEKGSATNIDREFCFDVSVRFPQGRTYLMAASSAEQLKNWTKLVALHRDFCELYPKLVMDPP